MVIKIEELTTQCKIYTIFTRCLAMLRRYVRIERDFDMKKLMVIALLTILFVIFITACRSETESELESGDNVHIVDEALTEDEAWTDDVDIIGLPVGEYTYVRSTISLAEHDTNYAFSIHVITVINETVYGAVGIWTDDSTDRVISFFSVNLDTEDTFFYPSSTNLTGEGNNIQAITANKDGDIFYINHKFIYDTETPMPEEILILSQVDISGNIGFNIDITELVGISEHDYWITPPRAIVLDAAGNIYVQAADGSVLQFDSTGAYQFTASHPEGTWTSATGIPFQGTDGTLMFPIWDIDEGSRLFSIDSETHSLIPHNPLPDAPEFSPGLDGNELFLTTNAGVYSYCLESGEQSRVFHWLELGMPPVIVLPAGEGRFAFLNLSETSFPDVIGVLTRTAMQDDVRTVVTMASLSPNYWFVREFNRQSTEYRIVVLDYSDDDISAAVTRFSIDMMTGRNPDIIDFTHLNYHVLANGGFLADLNKWFDYDNSINRTDFHERAFELLEIDGYLYAVAPSFMIATYLAPASLVGSRPGMTLEHLIQLDEQFNDGNSLLDEVAQSFVNMHSMFSRSTLIDFDMGTVHFETDEFIQVLEYASRMEYADISTQNELQAPNYERVPFEIDIRRGNGRISFHMIEHLSKLHQIELYAGTEITPIGFPVDDGVGSLMLPISLFGIGEGAQNPLGAWAFLRFLLTTMQEEMRDGILVSRAMFDEWANQEMNPPPIDDNPHLANEVFVDGVLVEFTPITQEQVDRTLEIIETLGELLVDGDEIVMHIVAEEASAFLNGHGSAEDAARIIQSRVEIYVSERR